MPTIKKHPDEADMAVRLGHCIRLRREQQKMTQKRLGQAINVSHQQVGRYETGENDLSIFRFWRMADALQIDPCKMAELAFSRQDKSSFEHAMGDQPSLEDELLAIFRNFVSDQRREEIRDFALAVYRNSEGG